MVLDPFTALSVAGNIVQFTDFGIQLIKEGRDLYASADGSLQHNREFRHIADDLKRLIGRVRKSVTFPVTGNDLTTEESSIDDIAKECERLADILLGILDSLKIQPEDKQRKWHTFQQALKSMCGEKKINNIAQRLTNARGQLNTNILVNLNERINVLSLHQSQLFETLDLSTRAIIEAMVANRTSSESAVVENISLSNKAVRQDITEAKAEIINAVRLLDWTEWSSREVKGWESTNYKAITPEQKKAAFKPYACQRLSYRTMAERHGDIPQAHQSTFQWIYKPPVPDVGTWSDFSQWLSQENGIYWIQGKPGSGKSCLMKYLSHQEETRELLVKWAGEVPLIIASFFF